jgi:hypothetical protein
MQPLPDASRLPVTQSPPAGGAATAAERLGQQPPWAARAQGEDDATEHRAIGDARTATLRFRGFLWQQGVDGFPQSVGHKD